MQVIFNYEIKKFGYNTLFEDKIKKWDIIKQYILTYVEN